ncbi:efflux RND transporter permease subunit [Gracilinema caldarium]|uniref:Acriflavin resistance protein n=1 Tax=Gracilinema caldarium (strain ATCC 51460 / DSM 7334 / H1) TaxID=744872 RepID=F8EWX4_GRAC1|nr:efflux RND transporter permease subunit [Gracilinema caldarium]AEJ18360.1 acriflavin resistance protein [Gracilinema caldarium DSM 7334]
MSIAKTVVSRPTTIFIAFILLLGLGVFATINLPIDLYPEIEPPILVVLTSYSGAGPEEVEKTITRPLEGTLSNVSSLEKLTSSSSKGSSMIMLEFTYGTDMADAANSVRDNLELVKRFLPEGSDTPLIFKFDPSMIPIMGLMVTGNRTPEELREISENTILPRIEQVPGVAMGAVSGGREKIIKVEIPQNRLEAYGLTITQIKNMLSSQNIAVSAGSILDNGLSYLLTSAGEYRTLDEIRSTVISYKGGGLVNGEIEPSKVVRLQDIADVYEGYRDEDSLVFVNGQAAVQITVQKQSGKNSVQTARELRKRLNQISKEIPQGIKITEIFNTTDIIENSINQVTSSALQGAILAVLILFVFLRSFKPTLIIGITIPVSLLFTLMAMYFWGLTLNVMTLAGLALGVGMLVDNSIVILENIYRYREKGAKLTAAAILGSQEMINAIVSSTLTTICVFAPLVMFKSQLGIVGELFAGLAFTVVISLTMSLAVAMMLIPVLTSHYLPLTTRVQKPLRGFLVRIDRPFALFFSWLDQAYRHAVDRVLRRKLLTVLTIAILFIVSIISIPRIGYVFMPEQQADSVTLSIELPVGTPITETEAVLKQIQTILEQEVKGYKRIILTVGQKSFFGLSGSSSVHKGSLQITLPDYKERIDSAETMKNKIRAHFNDFPGVMMSFSSGQQGGRIGSSSPIDIVIKTQDLIKGKAIAERIAQLLKEKVPEAKEPFVDLKDGLPQVELIFDRERMYSLGLNVYTVGNELKAAVDGVTATKFRSSGNEYDVVLILPQSDRNELPALDKIFVMSPAGLKIPLASFAQYKKTTGPITINRENQGRVIHVTAGTSPGVPINKVESNIRELIQQEIPAEDDVVIEYAGDYQQLMEYIGKFALIMLVAAFLVFGVMASQFESFRDPFIIIFTIPLSVIGIVVIYAVTGEVFNILTAVGLLVLMGVIVNNGIVLVDYTNLLRKRGLSLHDACVEAAGNRLRPILMTTLTTVLGLVPMAFFPGEGSELVAPIGKTVLGGLSFGTLMTLFLMPVIYAIFNKRADERAARAEARRERIAAGLSKKAAQEVKL